MAFQGFGKNSGPSAAPTSQNPFPHFPRPPSPTPPFSASHLQRSPSSRENIFAPITFSKQPICNGSCLPFFSST
ncbi:hypothetical protein CsSME_00035512 [Camellia sinensis var. sinensis]